MWQRVFRGASVQVQSMEVDILNGSFCNLCALALALTFYIFATKCSWVLLRAKQLSTVAILLHRFLSCWSLETTFTQSIVCLLTKSVLELFSFILTAYLRGGSRIILRRGAPLRNGVTGWGGSPPVPSPRFIPVTLQIPASCPSCKPIQNSYYISLSILPTRNGMGTCMLVKIFLIFLHNIVLLLAENLFNITVYTADLKLAGTTSRVYINIYGMLYGLEESTAKLHLTNRKNKEFSRGRWDLMIHVSSIEWKKVSGEMFAFGAFSHTPDKQSRANGTTPAQSLTQPSYNFGPAISPEFQKCITS